jgi:hypothetical protein
MQVNHILSEAKKHLVGDLTADSTSYEIVGLEEFIV